MCYYFIFVYILYILINIYYTCVRQTHGKSNTNIIYIKYVKT